MPTGAFLGIQRLEGAAKSLISLTHRFEAALRTKGVVGSNPAGRTRQIHESEATPLRGRPALRERAGEEAPRNFRVHQRWPVALARASAKPVTSAAVLHLRIPGRFSTDSSLPFLRATPAERSLQPRRPQRRVPCRRLSAACSTSGGGPEVCSVLRLV